MQIKYFNNNGDADHCSGDAEATHAVVTMPGDIEIELMQGKDLADLSPTSTVRMRVGDVTVRVRDGVVTVDGFDAIEVASPATFRGRK